MTNEVQVKSNDNTVKTITYVPPVDLLYGADETLIFVDMPGVDEHSVEATLEENVLVLKGQRHIENPQGYTVARTEYAPTEFRRMFEVSHEVDRNRIKAAMKNGVLRVTLPRAEQAKPKKIEISST